MSVNTNQQKYLSVCIPTYEMNNVGHIFLKQSFDMLMNQTFKDFEIIISDHSQSDSILDVCNEYAKNLHIRYFRNTKKIGNSSANLNNALAKATGKLIKILFQDDFLYSKGSLQEIINGFNLNNDHWLVTACEHSSDGKTFFRPFHPYYNKNIHLGKNTISSPSVLTIKNDGHLLFDERLIWLMDCDYYRRCYDVFGLPKILNNINVVNRIGTHQVSSSLATEDVRAHEYQIVRNKFSKKLQLPRISVVAVTALNPAGAIRALQLSTSDIAFYDAILIAHEKPKDLPHTITFKKCLPGDLNIKDPKNTNDYSKFMAYRLHEYIDSDFVLIVHNDAYVLRPEKWDNAFLNYDYIGAPWPANVHYTDEGVNVRVGNGGFSLRSNRLLNILNELQLPFTDNGKGYYHEDGIICNYYRKKLEDSGIRFAPIEVASRFSHEIDCPDSDPKPFGFHNNKRVIPTFFHTKFFFRKLFDNI